jgi:hypothetical protein
VSTPQSRREEDPSLPALPSPGCAAARPGLRLDPAKVHAPRAGSDARYEQLRHAALHGRAEAFPLGLAVLTRQGLTAWTRTIAELTPTPTAPTFAATDAPTPLPPTLTRELVNILAALTLVST